VRRSGFSSDIALFTKGDNILDGPASGAIAPPGQEGRLRQQEKAAKLLSGAAGVVVQ